MTDIVNTESLITDHPIDATLLTDSFNIEAQQGAVVTFSGYMREFSAVSSNTLTLDAYRPLTDHALHKVVTDAKNRFDLTNVHVVHRIGTMKPTDLIVWIGVGSRHRKDAFSACEFIIDVLKTQVPLWKRESDAKSSKWVRQQQSDLKATERWVD